MFKFIEEIFKNFGYYFHTPKTDTFGGYIYYLFWYKKIRDKINSKNIIITQLFDPNSNHYYKSSFSPPLNFKLSLYKDLNILEKFLSIIFSSIVFFNSIIFYFIFLKRFKQCFGLSLGYSNRLKDNLSYFDIDSAETLYEIESDYNFLNLNKKQRNENSIVFCVKDLNYLKFKQITEISCADIENYRTAIESLTLKFKMIRVGDPSNKDFHHKDLKNFKDFTKNKKYFELMFDSFFQSKYYFGTGGSQSYIGLFSNSERYISNSIDYCALESSFSNSNFCIFKYIFCKKKERFLSITEIYGEGHFFKIFENVDDYIFVENDMNEINNLAKILISKNKNEYIDSDLIKEFNKIRHQNFIKFKLKHKEEYFRLIKNCKINVPKFFLQNTMNYGTYLREKTKKFLKNEK